MNPLKHPILTSLVAVVCLVIAFALWNASTNKPTPQRAGSSIESAQALQEAKRLKDETATKPLVIEPTDILSIAIPSVAINAKVSGETWPRESPRCHGAPTCIDPPLLKEAAWYGAYSLPSVPSTDTVLVFGHSNWNNTDQQVFNDLPAVVAGDAVILTTRTGEFTYQANPPTLEPYDTIHLSELVYGHVPNRVVMVTCNDKEQAATVVTADLVYARPL